jgi:hypothetical protein
MDKYVIFHIDGGVQPLTPDYTEVLGKQVCDWIDNNFAWYQQGFGYTK